MAETTYNNLIVQALQDQQEAVDALAASRAAIAAAITAKGVSTSASTRFNAMAAKINSIKLGATIVTGKINVGYSPTTLNIPCDFTPTLLIAFCDTNVGSSLTSGGGYFLYIQQGTNLLYLHMGASNAINYNFNNYKASAMASVNGVINIGVPTTNMSTYKYFMGAYSANGSTIPWTWYAIK